MLSEPPASFDSATVTPAGDADLLAPALRWAASRNEMVVLGREEVEAGVVLYELMTIRDEPAWVRAERDGDGWCLSARVGRFGDAEREEALLEATRDRLDELASR